MKRIFFLSAALALWTAPGLRAQDAATEERLNKLAGQIEDLMASQRAQQKQIETLRGEIESLKDQAGKPNTTYAGQEDLKRLKDAVQEVDRKRLEDYDKIRSELLKLGKSFGPASGKKPSTPVSEPGASGSEKAKIPDKGFEYIIKDGDTLSVIVAAYRDKNIKVTTDQILRANPGLKPEKMKVGQKIFIPAPQA